MATHFPALPFCLDADDGYIHCRTLKQARYLRERLAQRLKACGLELHPDKTKVVYCRDIHPRADDATIQFNLLGYKFRPRRSKDHHGRIYSRRATQWVERVAHRQPELFPHWRLGFVPAAGIVGAG